MTTLERQEYRVSGSLDVAEVEGLLDLTTEHHEPCEWFLDLSGAKHVQQLAGPRLAASLRALARERLVVKLPAPADRFRVLYRSGLAAAIAAHADEVVGEADHVIEQLRIRPTAGVMATNLITFTGVDDGALVVRKDRFASRLWTAMRAQIHNALTRVSGETRAALLEAGYEGVANVVDHAFARPFEDGERRMSFCLLSWQRDMSANPSDPLGLTDYFSQARNSLKTEGLRWLVLAVVDDGNGIPARHCLDDRIYDGPFADEERALARALLAGETIKMEVGDADLRGDPGWGLTLIADALETAKGYGCLRTGRQLIEIDAFGAGNGWVPRPDPQPLLHGTVLQVVLPVEDPQQGLPI